ncbi:MAG: pilin, partial [Patescibacteria group bacterium]|nr:pilin [Patescibacteria group bacterium]
MNIKKITKIAIFVFAVIYANSAIAQQWTPLVRIPGLPATGGVSLSAYMVGLYDFLISIVGIVAVMMLIIGGMRYITSAGNQAAASDAKDIINNAIIGLILAVLSWVFIKTINPDVLYIKSPVLTSTPMDNSKCTNSVFDADPCVCIDGTNTPRVALGYTTCDEA